MPGEKRKTPPSICRTCGAYGLLATATQCPACWERTVAAGNGRVEDRRPVEASRVVAETVPAPGETVAAPGETKPPRTAAQVEADERWRELWARREAEAQARKERRGQGYNGVGAATEDPIDTWFDRHGTPGLCWFCHRRPGEAAYRGACGECFRGHQEPAPAVQPAAPAAPAPTAEGPLAGLWTPAELDAIRRCPPDGNLSPYSPHLPLGQGATMPETSATQTSNGPPPAVNGSGDRLQTIKDAHARVKARPGAKPVEARRDRVRAIVARLGPDSTYRQIREACQAEGVGFSNSEVAALKRELWPGQPLPGPGGRRGVSPGVSLGRRPGNGDCPAAAPTGAPARAAKPRAQAQAPAPPAAAAPPAAPSPTPAPAAASPAAPPSIDGIQAIGDAVAWCGGWAQFRRLVDAIEKVRANP